MSGLFFDLRGAFRQVARYRAFSTLVIVTLALGIGATTTFFSVLNALIFRPLAYQDPERLVAVRGLVTTGTLAPLYESLIQLPRPTSPFRSVVAYTSRDINATARDGAQRALSTRVSGDIFDLLGVSVTVGRPILPADFSAATPPAVISYQFWTRHYAGDAAVIGGTIVLDGAPHAIVGVAPDGFGFPGDTDIWVPLVIDRGQPGQVDAIARLTDGVTARQASAMLAGLSTGLDSTGRTTAHRAEVIRLRDSIVSSKHRVMLTAVLTATILVLLIACANLAGLLAAHLDSRRHEIAVRVALGARRTRIMRLLLLESVVLAIAGGALGTLLAQWGIDLFDATLGKPQGAGWLNFAIDGRVLLFAFGVSLITALVFGLGPAMGATGLDLRGVLQEDGRAIGIAPRGRRIRFVLVAAQITTSLALISAAWSIVNSAKSFDAVSPGFDRDRLIVLRVNLAGRAYDSVASRIAFVDRALERIAGMSGVSGVSATSALPLADRDVPFSRIVLAGTEPDAAGAFASLRCVASSYPRIAGVPIRLGRSFSASEAADPRTALVLVNDTLARRYWPGLNPLGRRLRLADSPTPDVWLTVAGVVGDVSQRNPTDDAQNQIYLPLASGCDRDVSFVVRAVQDDRAIIAPAREAISGLDKNLPINARTMRDVYAWFEHDREGQGLVLAALGTVALLLAALGVYAVMSLLVSGQRQEFAIRLALGCSPSAVRRLVLARGLRVAAAGIGGGLLLGGLLTLILSRIFFGVRPFDFATVLGAVALLTTTTLVASWWPARRAMRVDPMATLRR